MEGPMRLTFTLFALLVGCTASKSQPSQPSVEDLATVDPVLVPNPSTLDSPYGPGTIAVFFNGPPAGVRYTNSTDNLFEFCLTVNGAATSECNVLGLAFKIEGSNLDGGDPNFVEFELAVDGSSTLTTDGMPDDEDDEAEAVVFLGFAEVTNSGAMCATLRLDITDGTGTSTLIDGDTVQATLLVDTIMVFDGNGDRIRDVFPKSDIVGNTMTIRP